MKIVTSENFEAEVLKSDKPVLVDFFADWCGPCHQLAPILEQVATEKADDLKIVKVDVEASEELAKKYFVQAMPTLLMIKDGEVVSKMMGAYPKKELVKWIDEALALPKGTVIDLAPKTVTLSDTEKKRLRAAFEAAVNKSPDADVPTTVLTADGSETTLRKVFKESLDNGELFKQVETMLGRDEDVTLKAIIADIKKTDFRLPPKP